MSNMNSSLNAYGPPYGLTCRVSEKKGKGSAKQPELPRDVQEAVAAVDAAVKRLPDNPQYTVFEAQEGGGWNQRGDDPAPQNPGSRVSDLQPRRTLMHGLLRHCLVKKVLLHLKPASTKEGDAFR